MKKLTIALVSMLFVFTLAAADQTAGYSWEDGMANVLGLYGEGDPSIILSVVTDPVADGTYSLQLEDNAPSGTPSAYIAWIKNLNDGDEVTASFERYDITPGGSPSCRIWGHWNDDPDDVMAYNGSASGNSDYGPGEGWDTASYTWTVEEGHTGLIVEVRTYSSPGDIVWIDNLVVTAPEGAEIIVPGGSGVTSMSWGNIKADFR